MTSKIFGDATFLDDVEVQGLFSQSYIPPGEVLTFAPFARDSTENINIDDEGDLSVGYLSNGVPAVLKPFGTADTDDDDARGWVAPSAASGWVTLRLLHTPTAEANATGLAVNGVQGANAVAAEVLGPYRFDTATGEAADAFVYTDKGVTTKTLPDIGGPGWSWDQDDSPSFDVGPSSGAGGSPDGYLYTESSSPASGGDQQMLEVEDQTNPGNPRTFDAATYSLLVQWKTNQRGDDNNATCELQTNENGAGWVTRFSCGGPSDPDKVASAGADYWVQREVDLTGVVSHASTRIRLLVTLGATGSVFHNDYGIDDVTIFVL